MDILLDEKFVWNTKRIFGLQIDIQKCLNSKRIKSKLGISFLENVENFVTKRIESHETHIYFYLRLNLTQFEEYTNSIHEGTNRGLKYNSAPVGPSRNIEKVLAIMCNNLERTGTKKKKIYPKILQDQKCTLNWNVVRK